MKKPTITHDDLAGLADDVRDLDTKRKAAMGERDDAIRQALREGMTAYRVAQITGLDERGVGRIREKGTKR